MKNSILQKLALYIYNNFLGNFLGFIVGMASTRLVSNFFATKSIKNLWGLTTKKTIVDKQTFSILEWSISILIGFVAFEIISKTVKKKFDDVLPSLKMKTKAFFQKSLLQHQPAQPDSYSTKDAATAHSRSRGVYRDVQ